MSSTTQEKYTEEEIKQIKECQLHGYIYTNPGALWYSPNVTGQYSMYAPPCNGCKMGCDEKRILKTH